MSFAELVKSVLSRKFAIAFVGILALCYIAYLQSNQLPFTLADDGTISILADPNKLDPNTPDENHINKGSCIDWKIPVLIFFLAGWTAGIQGYLDYCKIKAPAKPGN